MKQPINARCRCGSGKKYKNCCLAGQQPEQDLPFKTVEPEESGPHLAFQKMRIANAVKTVRDLGLDEAEFQKVYRILVPEANVGEIDSALLGLGEEDEFALVCRLMNSTTHLVRLDQTPLIASREISPDFLARFKAGCRVCGVSRENAVPLTCLVEVKSTEKSVFEMKRSLVQRRVQFAAMLGLPLLFAVRFLIFKPHPTWVVVHVKDGEGKLIVDPTALISDLSRILWDDFAYIMFPGVQFRTYWSATEPGFATLENAKGYLHKIDVEYKGSCCSFSEQSGLYLIFFDRFHLQAIDVTETQGFTIETLKPSRELAFLREFAFSMHKDATRTDGSQFTSADILKNLLEREPGQRIVDRDFVEQIADFWIAAGILGRMSLGDPDECLSTWKAYFSSMVE